MRRNPVWLRGMSTLNMAFLYLPIVVLIVFSFNASRLSASWQGWTLKWYRVLIEDQALLEATWNSLLIAVVSTTIATTLGVGVALGLERLPIRQRQLVEGGLLLPLVVPEVMMGVALLLFFVMVKWPLGIWSIIVGHVAFNLPVVMVIIRARLRRLDPHLEEAAFDLGATAWQVFRCVTLPLLQPAVLGAALMAFTISLDDFIVTFFTAGPGATTLPLKVYSMIKSGLSPEINALSALLVLISMGLIALSLGLQRRDTFTH